MVDFKIRNEHLDEIQAQETSENGAAHPSPAVNSPAGNDAQTKALEESWVPTPLLDSIVAIFQNLLQGVGVGGNLCTDAHLAALAIEYQGELHSTDVDFGRFPGLKSRRFPAGFRV